MPGQLVTIETGVACNNRCAFCPQPPMRGAGPARGDPGTEELKRKVAQAFQHGYDQIAFSGGEPSIRKDLPELVRYARSLGFERVSVTTNGRMFVYPEFTQRMIQAGLTGVSVSLHGPTEDVHDELTGVPGSFRQAVAGLANLRRFAAERGGRFDITSITILVPQNLDRLRETLVLAGQLGATLHVVQPFILSRETLGFGSRFLLRREAIVRGLEKALHEPLPHRGRVKPYNIPPCLLEGLGQAIEVQEYSLRTFRSYEEDLGPGTKRWVSGQFHRDERCDDCPLNCPGLRIEHVPEEAAAARILHDIDRDPVPVAGRDVILSSTDLLGARGLDLLLGGLRARNVDRIRVLWGGMGLASPEEFVETCRAREVDEVCLLVRPPQLRPPDQRVWLPGNVGVLADRLGLFRAGVGPVPSLFLVVNMLFSTDVRLDEDEVLRLVEGVRQRGGTSLFLAAPERLDAQCPAHDESFKAEVLDVLPSLLARFRDLGVQPFLVRTRDAPPDPDGTRLETRVCGLVPPVDWDGGFLAHCFTGVEHGWVMWSYPIWVRHWLPDEGEDLAYP